MLCYVLLLLKCIIFISLVCQRNSEFPSCCLKHLQLLCLWSFYVIIHVMNMQWYNKNNLLNVSFSRNCVFFTSHGLFLATVLPVVMSAAYGRSSRMNAQFIFTEGYSPGVSHYFLNICVYYLYLTVESSPFSP